MTVSKTAVLAIGKGLEQSYQSLRTAKVENVALFREGQPPLGQDAETGGFSVLRFEGETLLVALVEEAKVRSVVSALRRDEQAAIFIIAGDLREVVPSSHRASDLKYRLTEAENLIAETHRQLREAANLGHLVSPAAQWLADNAHSLRSHLAGIREACTRSLLNQVPRDEAGVPKVLQLAESILRNSETVISEDRILESLNRHQTGTILQISEIWLLPTMLRLSLVEFLAHHGKTITLAQQMREAAYFWANRIATASRAGEPAIAGVLKYLSADSIATKAYFLTSVAEQLQEEERALAPFRQWIEGRTGDTLARMVSAEHKDEASEGVSIANAFNSLRALSSVDFVNVFEQSSLVEKELRRDTVYARSDLETRNQARRVVETMARDSGKTELEVARAAAAKAATAGSEADHVLFYLLHKGRLILEQELGVRVPFKLKLERSVRSAATPFYLWSIGVLTLAFSLLALSLTLELKEDKPWILVMLWVLTLFPLSELAVQVVNVLVISFFPASSLPKMSFKEGIPPEHATLVVVPMMLANHEIARQEVEKLEVRYLANPGPNVFFSLFSDFLDSPDKDMPEDQELLQNLRTSIEALNSKYSGSRFLLFHRGRSWSESEQKWLGRERKRGKIEELNAFLLGEGDSSILVAGRVPMTIHYVITLDADTQLPPDTARRMIATIAHPLNRPVLDPVTRVRRSGYSIIQPRVSISLPGATATKFTRVMGDPNGTDPYCRIVSDAQQDLFGEAIFHGKAIYDLQAFSLSLKERFPAESVLSHDLIEGAFCGVGLATDIELFETMPVDYASFSRRQHRWIRGDWQIAPWIPGMIPAAGGERAPNPLSAINRWRIFDNLRRSLVPAVSVMLLLFGWFVSATPAVWTVLLTLAVAIPAVALFFDRLALRIQGSVSGTRGAYDEMVRAFLGIIFLPHQAWLSLDAIGRACYRMLVSRRNLLEWQTAESTRLSAASHNSVSLRQLTGIAAVSGVLAIWKALRGQPSAIPFLLLWASSPFVMQWLSAKAGKSDNDDLSSADRTKLRKLARQTWRFFDDLVGPQTHWLPPDNTQLTLHVEVADRTSPTNIGLWLTSALAAYDFGYLTADDLRDRCTRTMETLEKMERYEGHLLNWCKISTLEPLNPRYVSTVDSGNLVACLWILGQGCREILNSEPLGRQVWQGLADTFSNLQEAAAREAAIAFELRAFRKMLRGETAPEELPNKARLAATMADQIKSRLGAADEESRYWAEQLSEETHEWVAAADRYWSWLETLSRQTDSNLRRLGADWPELRRHALDWKPSLEALASNTSSPVDALLAKRDQAGIDPQVARWLDDLNAEFTRTRRYAAQAAAGWRNLSERTERFAAGVNMRFLYDSRRRLFGIGYAVGGPVEHTSHYDLLASECRIASMVAIAKADVPLEHWFSLGRPRTPSPSGQTLLSWSGTMFEYLMPLLFTRIFPNSLLEHACRDAVDRQIDYGKQTNLPWGVSESAYSALDSNGTYQYHAFGVPDLSLKGIPEGERVVAPYATALALQVNPEAAMENLAKLADLGLSGPMGFYEAVDFSRQQSPSGDLGVVIYTYMSHHQGMTLLSLDNVLHEEAMHQRFHGDLRIRAIESLLFERIPDSPLTSTEKSPEDVPQASPVIDAPPDRAWSERTAVPRAHALGNGRYSVIVTNSGAGYSRWKGFDINRWRSDATSDPWGSFVLLRDVKTAEVWAATHQPFGASTGAYTARFSADRADFYRRFTDIETNLQVAVAADHDVELRRLTVTNWSARQRSIDVTSFMEIALAAHGADKAHPAFSKMFVQTEHVDGGVLIASRRKRSPDEESIWVGHMLVGVAGAISYETDRHMFLGRGNSLETADAHGRNLTNSIGTVVDPVFSLRCRLNLEPRQRREISFLTLAAGSREELLALVAIYKREEAIPQLLEMVWNRAQLELRYLRIGPEDGHRFQQIASALLFPDPNLRAPSDRIARSRLGQAGLWAAGISGDLPMLAVVLADTRELGLVHELLLAHKYLRRRGLRFDLVVLNQEGASYERPLHQQLRYQVEAHSSEEGTDRPGGVFLREWHTLDEVTANQILAGSHVLLRGNRGSLSQQLGVTSESLPAPRFQAAGTFSEEPSQPLPFLELPYFNGLGGFTGDGREYAIYLKPGSNTPAPWANVMAHATFGCMVTESGLGFTWFGNSQANRLTPWHNDPVSDPQSEAIYLRDEESGAKWTPTPLPIREQDAYRARHGQGYSVFEHNSHAIGQELTVFVPIDRNGVGENVKVCRLKLRNDSSRARRLSVTYFAELVLGTNREDQQLHVSTSYDERSGSVLARQWWSGPRMGQLAFLASNPKPTSYTGDRTHFLGRNQTSAHPEALDRARLDNHTGPGLDPAAAIQVQVVLPKGGETEVFFLFGQCENEEKFRATRARFQDSQAVEAALNETKAWWNSIVGTIQVHTPILSVDLLLNRWLLYQSLSCRYWGRSALYQSGGAIGFRDQLQDSLAFVYARPELTRQHILTASGRQFVEGDVQHWWHPDTGLGVRTRCSDDMLWLPFVALHYVRVTGDKGILEETAPFLDGAQLTPAEHEKMFVPGEPMHFGSILDHCHRALERAGASGAHGLPLMGNGDWNDGMNRVGIEGKGESVWLAWFFCSVCGQFADLLDSRGDIEGAERLRKRRDKVAAAVEESCWDGDWYLRAFFDTGEAMGSHKNPEARIDSLPQSWGVISGAADPDRARRAMDSATKMLVDTDNRLVRLFTPPFDKSLPHPGYIMGYPPGLRENGGQYTHGSLWLAMAWARLMNGDEAVRLLTLMNPIEQTRTASDVARYRGEPYVVAADVSAAAGRTGQGGWTWYTGSAAWTFRIWIEEVLGITVRNGVLSVQPACPATWNRFDFVYRFGASAYEVEVLFDQALLSPVIEGDFSARDGGVLLVDDGRPHRIRITLALRRPRAQETSLEQVPEDDVVGSKKLLSENLV